MQPSQNDFDRAFAFLKSHSVDQTPHVGGTLLPHLEGTYQLLQNWGNSAEVCLAGLCHTTYGTDGFPNPLIDPSQRVVLERIIGLQSEQLVYLYASCDRADLYPRIARHPINLPDEVATAPISLEGFHWSPLLAPIQFRDRFTGTASEPNLMLYRAFLELTFANELEIFRRIPDLVASARPFWQPIFQSCRGLVSEAAFASFIETLGEA